MQKKGFLSILEIKSRSGNSYIYDASTNMIFHASPGFLEIVKSFYDINKEKLIDNLSKKFDKKIIEEDYALVEKLINNYHAFYFDEREIAQNFVPQSPEQLEKQISNLSHICLEMTQSCNLRCTYCIYSGSHKDFRVHGQKNMSFKVAKKSLDYFFSLINSPKRTKKFGNVFIAFWGGEPVLNFELIKKCVKYVKNIITNEGPIKDKIFFNITTNGLLLKEEIVRFLEENNFLIALSLDGPPEEHDKNRITKSGKGSFEIIWNNIRRLKKYHGKYFESNVIFLVTLCCNHNLERIDNFFRELIGDKFERIKVATVRDEHLFHSERLESIKDFENFKETCYNKILMKKPLTPFSDALLRPVFEPVRQKFFFGYQKTQHYTGACTPDIFRLTVSVDGVFHICERINPYFSIGDYKNGILFEKVKNILEYYNSSVVKKCQFCVAKHFCSLCYAMAADGKDFKPDEFCDYNKRYFQKRLADFISLVEENPMAFIANKQEDENDIFDKAFY